MIPVASFLGDISQGVLIGLIVAIILAAGGAVWRFHVISRVKAWWSRRRARRRVEEIAPALVEDMVSYLVHLRDVTKTPSRTRGEEARAVRERIRRDVLEPIRGYFTTPRGCEVKVVWFRPTDDGKELVMFEQVGHTPEGQRELRLEIGVGRSMAGEAFVKEETVWSNSCETEQSFQEVPKSKATGSLACVPIPRGIEVTGVLSVLANWPEAFFVGDITYFQALASAIGALEPLLEEGGDSANTNK